MVSDVEKELKEEEKEVKHERVEMQMEAPPRSIRWGKMAKAGLLIIVVGALFLFIGYKYGKESGNEATETTATETAVTSNDSATTVASASAATSADATANWKTYTNDTYGFSFKYPIDWTKATCAQGSSTFAYKPLTTDSADCFIFENASVSEHPGMMTMVYDGTGFGTEGSNFSYDASIVNNKLSLKTIDEIGNQVAKSIADNPNGPTDKSGDYGTTYFKFGTNDKYMFISTGYKYGGQSYRETLRTILSTFQFTK